MNTHFKNFIGMRIILTLAIFLIYFRTEAQLSAPVATAATNVTATSFTANWNSVSGALNYALDVSLYSDFHTFVYQNVTVGSSTVTSSSVTGLTANTTYYYRVRAQNSGGQSPSSGYIQVQPLLPAPTATAATIVTSSSFTANWGAISGATGYYLDVSTTSTFSAGTFLTGYNPFSTTLTNKNVTGLSAGTNYWYRVRAYNNSGPGPNSNSIQVLSVSSIPTCNPATNIASTSFTANWTAVTGATTYLLDVSTDNFSTFVGIYHVLSIAGTSSNVSGLTLGVTYSYRIRAHNSSGDSSPSSPIQVTTVPPAPTANAATNIGSDRFTAGWGSVSGATSYELDVATNSTFTTGLTSYLGLLSTSLNVFPVSANTTYFYRVRAKAGNGVSVNSSPPIQLTTLQAGPTMNATTSITSNSFTANWNTVGSATGYRVDVSQDVNFSAFVSPYSDLSIGNTTSYTVNNLFPGTTYYFRVRWQNSGTTSGNSSYITVTTLPNPPNILAPTNVTSNSFTANWTSISGASYLLDVSSDVNFLSSFVTNYHPYSATSNSAPVTVLNSGSTYYYRVRAVVTAGTTGNSVPIGTVNTFLVTPTALAATSVATNTFTASWTSVSQATSYELDISLSNTFSPLLYTYDPRLVNTTSLSIPAASNTTYYYRVRARNGVTGSLSSNTISVLTYPDPPHANAGSNPTATSFQANWNAVSGITSYLLEVATDANFVYPVAGYNPLSVTGTSQSVSGLPIGKTFYYRLRSVNATGNSTLSNIIVGNSTDNNYIKAIEVIASGITNQTQLDNSVLGQRNITTEFFDGLGRSSQKVLMQNSPLQLDVVQPVAYDKYGRQEYSYLPFVSSESNGWFKYNPIGTTTYTGSPHNLYYSNGASDKVQDDTQPYARKIFEASPLDRVLQDGAPGALWQPVTPLNYASPSSSDHSIKHSFQSNVANEVFFFVFDPATGMVSLSPDNNFRFYAPNQLQGARIKDEKLNEVIQYTDKLGHMVCKKVQSGVNGSVALYTSTYYVYDGFGNLVVVLPPEAVNTFNPQN